MAVKKPKVLILFAREAARTSTKYAGFITRIQKNGGFSYADVECAALENLIFHIKNKQVAQVYDPKNNIDLSKYDFVYLKSWQSMPELAASVAHYLEGQGIPYADHQARHEYIAKTTNYMAMWAHGVSVPETVWGTKHMLLLYIDNLDASQFPLIIKAVHGQKGKDNYLVHSQQEARQLLEKTDIDMVIQQFISNDGDYRIGVYGYKGRWAIYRRSGGTSHLNNTSAGAIASNLSIDEVPGPVLKLAEAAAAACDLAISGVDVVEDKFTKELYVFEANQGSQIVTGAFTDTNMAAFDEGLESLISRRFKNGKSKVKRPQVIGRLTYATIRTDAGDLKVKAKVDSGAYQSAIDAMNISLQTDMNGKEFVYYELFDKEKNQTLPVRSYDFGRARIQSSTGHIDVRYVVPMTIEIGSKEYNTRVTLASRTKLKSQMLIGRQLLRGNFLINVELGL
ncbi:MAG: RimK/LysX family protein [Candidatus Microsaccharimonas sp.]